MGYNTAVGNQYGIATLEGVFDADCSVSSQASLSRRTGITLAFSATVSQVKSASAIENAASVTPESFATGVSKASSAQGVTVPVPTAEQISGVTVTATKF